MDKKLYTHCLLDESLATLAVRHALPPISPEMNPHLYFSPKTKEPLLRADKVIDIVR